MNPLTTVSDIVLGLSLRLGLPLIVTAGAIWLLRRVDSRWQQEAEQARVQAPQAAVPHCWEQRHCPPERVVTCAAYLDQSRPCWQTWRDPQGNLQQRCLACQLFQQATAPTASRPQVHWSAMHSAVRSSSTPSAQEATSRAVTPSGTRSSKPPVRYSSGIALWRRQA